MTNYQYTKAEEDRLKFARDAAVEALQFVNARISELSGARNEAEARLQKLDSQLPKTAANHIPAIAWQMQELKATISVFADLIDRESESRPRLEADVKRAREMYAKYVNERKADEANRATRQKLGWG